MRVVDWDFIELGVIDVSSYGARPLPTPSRFFGWNFVGIVFRSETKFPILNTCVNGDKKSEIRLRGVGSSNSVKD